MASVSPTQRSLRQLRREGWLATVVEYWHAPSRRRRDLYGLWDILAVRDGETLAVQTTSTGVAARIRKISDSEVTPFLRRAGWRLQVHGWRKSAKGKYVLRVVDVS